jgi:hypothetical protein
MSAMVARGAVIVSDNVAHQRLRREVHVTGAPHIRFYAGFPIEAVSGDRIGAPGVFGVFDPPELRADSGFHAV